MTMKALYALTCVVVLVLPTAPAVVELAHSVVCYLFLIYQALSLKPPLSFGVLALSKPIKELLKEIGIQFRIQLLQ